MDSKNNTENQQASVGGIRFDALLYAEKPNYKHDLYLDLIQMIVISNFSKDIGPESFQYPLNAEEVTNREMMARQKYRNDPYFAAFCKMQVAQIFEIINKNLGI